MGTRAFLFSNVFLILFPLLAWASNPACNKEKEQKLIDGLCMTIFKQYETLSNANTDIDDWLPVMKVLIKARKPLSKLATVSMKCNSADYSISTKNNDECTNDKCMVPAKTYLDKICGTLSDTALKINRMSRLCPESFSLSRSVTYLIRLKRLLGRLSYITNTCQF